MYRITFGDSEYYAYFYEKPSYYDMLKWVDRLPLDLKLAVWRLPMGGVGEDEELVQ